MYMVMQFNCDILHKITIEMYIDMHNENKDTKCKFCEEIESLQLQDESGNNIKFKKGQIESK